MTRVPNRAVSTHRTLPDSRPATEDMRVVFASLFCVAAATLVAVWTLPADPTPAGTLAPTAAVLLFGLLGGLVCDVALHGPGRALRAQYFVLLGIAYFLLLDLIQGRYPIDSTPESIQSAILALGLFAASVVLGATVRPGSLPQSVQQLGSRQYGERTLRLAIIVSFALGMLDFAYWCGFSPAIMLEGLQAPRFAAPWSRGAEGGWNAFLDFMINFGFVLPTLTLMLAVVRGHKWLHWSVLGGVILSGIFVAFVAQGGGRRIIASILLAPLIAWSCHNRRRLAIKHIFGAASIVIVAQFVLEAMLENRNRGFGEFSYDVSSFSGIRVDDNFNRMAQVFYAIPDFHPYVGMNWVVWVLARPIPRVLWPDKPLDPGFFLASFEGLQGTSLSTGIVGEWYMAFGLIGVVVGGMATGYLARCWSELLELDLPIAGSAVYALGAMALFVGVRSGIELILFTYPILCWLFIDWLFLGRDQVPSRRATPRTGARYRPIRNSAGSQ